MSTEPCMVKHCINGREADEQTWRGHVKNCASEAWT